MTRIYADYAASAPLRPCAEGALRAALAADLGNPSSSHRAGARARALLETAREDVADVLGAHPLEVVFTSGATEANNLALRGAVPPGGCVAVAATDHASVLEPARALAGTGHRLVELPVSAAGAVDPAALVAAAPALVSFALVNAETGVVQDAPALIGAARRAGARVHVDAAQALATIPCDVRNLDVDLLTVSGHKLGGPTGAGALYVRRGVTVAATQHGGPQEGGRRAGTENVPAIVALAAALRAAAAERTREVARLGALTGRLRAAIATRWPAARLVTGRVAPHIVHATFPEVEAESLVTALDLEGIAVSAGSACAAGAVEPSHVLLAMGWGRDLATGGLRMSVGWASRDGDVERIVEALTTALARRRGDREGAPWPAHAS